MLEILSNLFQSYGYSLVFLVLFLENLILVGLFFPGDVMLVLASFLARESHLSLYKLIIVASSGAFLGNLAGYCLGRWKGELVLNSLPLSKDNLEKSKKFFLQHGSKAVFLARFAAGIRTFMPTLAGAHHLSFLSFTFYSLAAILIWVSALCSLGFYFGQNLDLIIKLVKRSGYVGLIVFVLILVLGGWWQNKRQDFKKPERKQ